MDNIGDIIIPLIGSTIVIIGSVLINIYNRLRRQPIEEPVLIPEIIAPVVLKHSKSYDELKSFYQSLKLRHNNSPQTI